jgi:hypothetical protein
MDLLTPNLEFVKNLSEEEKLKFLNDINSIVNILYFY